MFQQNSPLSKTLNPCFSTFTPYPLTKISNPLYKPIIPTHSSPKTPKYQSIKALFSPKIPSCRPSVRSYAGRSKKKEGGTSTGRIEGNAELRREAKRNVRRKSKKLAENLFYRLKNPHGNYPNNFTEEELQMIGLGYDRMVQFMEKDDPNLKHPYDWYKYGEFGPYSWRGVVLGEPIRGRFSDENVTLIGEVRDQEEWEKIEQFEMSQDFGQRLESMDKSVGFRYFWVFVRHPKWRVSDLPWEQWTLVSEVVVEAGKQRLDKWNLMGRLGNRTRSLITKCAAWVRPDIIYVKRPVYQCRFEPQDEFFKSMTPLLDPETERDYMCQLESDDGGVETCTYFGGLCKILGVNQKSFVDDVVKAFEKASDEKKSKCLEFLLGHHPVELLHPYTKEWKAKLEEMEFGCDAPDENDDGGSSLEVLDWVEDDENEEEDDDIVIDAELDDVETEDDNDDGSDGDGDDDGDGLDEDEKYWEEEFKKAVNSNEEMEVMARRSVKMTKKLYEKQAQNMEEKRTKEENDKGEMAMRRGRAKVTQEEWKQLGYGPRMKKIKKSRIPPGQFLRAAVRPFLYKNLVKEIVLTRHAIVEGEIGGGKKK
ncbi:hypothetical protein HanRHA438_Chr03g0126741 [Helianthus annuus]|uniref:Uncharacterized protein n=1 Tax=Helianthus annuus TaxID=4232 RepID=A0A251S7T5_HELAN|nr:uncharacterized protein LOC110911356 [Helianthus annuus]KAF5814765.1 hypothetical protein HanXRQr2_Chr03g0114791 [Helianthus annuus]KAJ0601194.1 hypothetical protein HanIR_Chr03g0125611 [Helianthus annuus]KAJ0774160.1 hypothetical protein HanOQP8_Chr03g0108441 [Helianthus annuus]KAJ0936075.1 hypothetical protein HanRHA438_Chr03g0126741 [Helianthus annuus]KAJ0944000.1 hypothetical protein HanPSC8_Chr03g0111161 [Helianthus annuus]